MTIYEKTQKQLFDLSEEKYRKFSASLIPNIANVLGVRIPVLRKVAKQICDNEEWEKYVAKMPKYMEEAIIQAIIIGAKAKSPKDFDMIEKFVVKIDNWAVCDCFCSSLKMVKKYKEETFDFLLKYLNSKKEFEVRFALVVLLDYFVDEKYLGQIFNILNSFCHNGYYAQMAAAWLGSVCFVEFPDETFEYLKNSKLDKTTFNKTIQKIRESYRVEKSVAAKLQTLKK